MRPIYLVSPYYAESTVNKYFFVNSPFKKKVFCLTRGIKSVNKNEKMKKRKKDFFFFFFYLSSLNPGGVLL